MGKTKIKTIDDSMVEELKDSNSQKSQKKKQKILKRVQDDKVIIQDDTSSVIPVSETQPESNAVIPAEAGIQAEEKMDSGSKTSVMTKAGGTSTELSEDSDVIARSQGDEAISSDGSPTRQALGDDKGGKALGDDNKKAAKKKQKPGKRTKVRSKKYQQALEKVERTKAYPLNEAVDHAKEVSYTKFDGTLEIHLNTNQKNLRGLVTLPYSAGKKLNVLAFGEGASESGADIAGSDEIIDSIGKGKIDFDVIVTTPAWMPKLAKAAKILGPRGLMPNPKNGTITDNLKKAVSELQSGKTEYKTEKAANVMHLGIGKVSQETSEVAQNIKMLITTIGKSRITKATLSPTMGPGVKLDLNSI